MDLINRKVNVPINFEAISDKNFKYNFFLVMIDYSIYDEEDKCRYLERNSFSYAGLSASKIKVSDNPRTLAKYAKHMFANHSKLIGLDEENSVVVIHNDDRYNIALPHKDIKYLYYNFEDDVVKLYLFLCRQYSYWTQIRHIGYYDSTLGDLAAALGYNPRSNGVNDKIKNYLDELDKNGLISYNVVKKFNRGSYHRISFVKNGDLCS